MYEEKPQIIFMEICLWGNFRSLVNFVFGWWESD